MTDYVHGYGTPEQQRLVEQAEHWRHRLIRDGTELEPGTRLLEVGCGVGAVLAVLGQEFPGVELFGVDVEPKQLAFARRHLEQAGVEATLVEADALALPFDDGSFDAVVMANLLHLLPDPKLALAEARRVLRPDGLLCAPTFCHGEHALARAVSGVLALARFPVVTRFSADSLVTTIDNAGFRVVDTRTYRGLLPLCLVVARLP